MKAIIAGSRGFTNFTLLRQTMDKFVKDVGKPTEIISGEARGADQLGERWATTRRPKIPLILMPAEWDKYGRSAGYRRNREMALVADACVCFWDGQSKGTKHMIDLAMEHCGVVWVVRTDDVKPVLQWFKMHETLVEGDDNWF